MSDPAASSAPVVVVGGGWAGLAAAVTLCRHKVPVVVLESARQPGGRARSVRIGETVFDNGQHLMIGAYQSMLTLMTDVGVNTQQVFERLPLTLHMQRGEKTSLHLRAPRLPPPLHMLAALISARGLSIAERMRALRFGHRLPGLDIPADADISVQALLHSAAQTPGLIRKLWEPLCIASLNTPTGIASARLFVNVLRTTFSTLNAFADLLIPRVELSDLLPRPCTAFLEREGARIELGQRVTSLDIETGRARGVDINGRPVAARDIILATPHVITRRLVSHHPALTQLAGRLAQLGNEPVSTLYLQYPAETRLPLPVTGLENSLAQWVFDRRVCGQAGLMAVVISARGEHSHMPVEQLTQAVAGELASCFPHWAKHRDSQLIREKRSTFCSRVGIDAIRPGNRTPVRGLWLAGDYTDTQLPATLESAVRSGISCAQAVLRTSPS